MKLGEDYSVLSDYNLDDAITTGEYETTGTEYKILNDFDLDKIEGGLKIFSGVLAVFFAFLLFFLIFLLAVYIYNGIVNMKINSKANHRNPWASWIPFYNWYVTAEVCGYPGWLGLITCFTWLIPIFGWLATLVIRILILNKLSTSFGKDSGFTVGLVLLNPIFLGILAFGKSEYVGPDGDSKVVPEWSNASK